MIDINSPEGIEAISRIYEMAQNYVTQVRYGSENEDRFLSDLDARFPDENPEEIDAAISLAVARAKADHEELTAAVARFERVMIRLAQRRRAERAEKVD